MKKPRRLYKYRDFNDHTLDMVLSNKVYYADPSTFNDPLDTRPTLETDLDEDVLEKILRNFVERRTSAEMKAAAQTIKYGGPNTTAHIEWISRRQADRLIEEIENHATNLDVNYEDHKRLLLEHDIKGELLGQYDKGIVSLTERATCSLMWSHYGGQHRGICIGYSVPDSAIGELYKVKYGGDRLVKASKIAAMLDGNECFRAQVDEAVLLRKATGWRYEREWRLIGPHGLRDSPLELEEIVFGMRCKESVKYAMMKALEGRD